MAEKHVPTPCLTGTLPFVILSLNWVQIVSVDIFTFMPNAKS